MEVRGCSGASNESFPGKRAHEEHRYKGQGYSPVIAEVLSLGTVELCRWTGVGGSGGLRGEVRGCWVHRQEEKWSQNHWLGCQERPPALD